MCKKLVELGLKPFEIVLREVFSEDEDTEDSPRTVFAGETHPGDFRLEIIRVLALRSPCCHLIKPAIAGAVKVRPSPPPPYRPFRNASIMA